VALLKEEGLVHVSGIDKDKERLWSSWPEELVQNDLVSKKDTLPREGGEKILAKVFYALTERKERTYEF